MKTVQSMLCWISSHISQRVLINLFIIHSNLNIKVAQVEGDRVNNAGMHLRLLEFLRMAHQNAYIYPCTPTKSSNKDKLSETK